MRWLIVAVFTTAAAVAAGQNPSLPEGEGKAIVQSSCASCHGLDLITPKQATKDEWSGIVDRMKGYGLNLSAPQSTTVVDYLAKSFGPKGQAAPAAGAPAAGGQNDATETQGKAMVDGLCSSCHGADLITAKQIARTEWQGIVDRMKGYGANLDDKQTTTLLDYLAKHYGPKDAAAATSPSPSTATAAADPGKAVLDGFCTSCHDLDLVSGRTGTESEWKDIVDRMNGRGAGVADKDVPVLVQYLTKTYGRK